MKKMNSDQEPVNFDNLQETVTSVGGLLGVIHCLVVPNDDIPESPEDVEVAVNSDYASMPKLKDFLDGHPTKGDLRKYVIANLKHMLSVAEGK